MNNKNHRNLLAYAATTLLLLGCAESEKITEEPHSGDVQSIGFSIDVSQDWYAQKTTTRAILEQSQPRHIEMKCSDGSTAYLLETTRTGIEGKLGDTSGSPLLGEMEGALDTRGTLIGEDRTGMGSFSSFCYKGSDGSALYANDQTSNTGALSSQRHWPDTESSLYFYAVHPYDAATAHFSAPASSDGLKYNFTLNPTVASQADLMYASTGSFARDAAATKQTVPLRFKHALTAVRFKLGEKPNFGRTIKSISLKNVYTQGMLTLPNTSTSVTTDVSAVWTPTGEKTGTITLDDIGFDANSDSYSGNVIKKSDNEEYFLMIPQDLAGVVIEVVFTDGTKLSGTLSSGQWKAGTTVDYALSDDRDNWEYTLTLSDDYVKYDATSATYGILSYRTLKSDPTKQVAVPWEIVSYEEDPGTQTHGLPTTTPPTWVTNLSLLSGNGGTETQYGTATLTVNLEEKNAEKLARDNDLKDDTNKKGTEGNPYNLSDPTNTGSPQNTANCYVISGYGYYKLPLVYGNAIKNGASNWNAYHTDNTGTYVLQNFLDYKGLPIFTSKTSDDDPWIKNNETHRNNSEEGIPTSASLVWSDISTSIVSDMAISEDKNYLTFQIKQSEIEAGNAVIAVKDESGTVMWSWHLWFAPASVLTPIHCVNANGEDLYFTTENLGYTPRSIKSSMGPGNHWRTVWLTIEQKESHDKKTLYITQLYYGNGANDYSIKKTGANTRYQFGRKDALPGNKSIYPTYSSDNPSAGGYNYYDDLVTYSTSIQNPGTIYYSLSSREWHGNETSPIPSSVNNAWSANNADFHNGSFGIDDFPTSSVVKTVYDPCPVGFKIPGTNAFTGFQIGQTRQGGYGIANWTDFGIFYTHWRSSGSDPVSETTIYLPAMGLSNGGSIDSYGGGTALYHTAIPYSINYPNHMSFHYNEGYYWAIYPLFNSNGGWARSYGCSVRPVQE